MSAVPRAFPRKLFPTRKRERFETVRMLLEKGGTPDYTTGAGLTVRC